MLPLPNSTLVARLGALALLAAAPAAAQTDAVAVDRAGNQTFANTLSQEFTVSGGPIRITRFGAFDDDGLGFAESITVRLYDAATGSQVGESIAFTGLVGSASGSFRYLNLANPIDLAVGFVGRISAIGYGGAERYYNAAFGSGGFVTLNSGGALSFGRVYYDADGTGFPDTPSGNQHGGWYGAASFTFGPPVTTTTPEPATWATLGGGLLALGAAARRRRAR